MKSVSHIDTLTMLCLDISLSSADMTQRQYSVMKNLINILGLNSIKITISLLLICAVTACSDDEDDRARKREERRRARMATSNNAPYVTHILLKWIAQKCCYCDCMVIPIWHLCVQL